MSVSEIRKKERQEILRLEDGLHRGNAGTERAASVVIPRRLTHNAQPYKIPRILPFPPA